MIKDNLINNLHEIMKTDTYLNEIFTSAGITLDNVEATIKDLEDQYYFDTITWGLDRLESDLGIPTNIDIPIENRRSAVQSKWIGNGKTDIELLQKIANAWHYGQINVEFVEGNIKLYLLDVIGIPFDLSGLQKSLDDVKPAHLPIIYVFRYLKISEIQTTTIGQLQNTKMNKFIGGV